MEEKTVWIVSVDDYSDTFTNKILGIADSLADAKGIVYRHMSIDPLSDAIKWSDVAAGGLITGFIVDSDKEKIFSLLPCCINENIQ